MEKYLEMMKRADEECGRIASRVKRYAQNLAEIDNGTIYAVAYRAVKKEELEAAFTAEIIPMCEKAAQKIEAAVEEAVEPLTRLDFSNAADLVAALQIIGAEAVTAETREAMEDHFRGRRQCQLVLNAALEAHNMRKLDVFDPRPGMMEAATAIEAASHFTNPADLFRELLRAQRAFNRMFADAGVDCTAAWDLPVEEIKEHQLRLAMGL